MLILGIDPGTLQSGIVLWDTDKEEIQYNAIVDNAELQTVIYEQGPDKVVVEMISNYGNNVGAETYQTVLIIGRLQEFCRIYQIPCRLITRIRVRLHITGTSHAGDTAIRRAILDRYGYWGHGKTGVGTKEHPGKLYGVSSHMMSALAVAITMGEKPDLSTYDLVTPEIAEVKKAAAAKKRAKKKAKAEAEAHASGAIPG